MSSLIYTYPVCNICVQAADSSTHHYRQLCKVTLVLIENLTIPHVAEMTLPFTLTYVWSDVVGIGLWHWMQNPQSFSPQASFSRCSWLAAPSSLSGCVRSSSFCAANVLRSRCGERSSRGEPENCSLHSMCRNQKGCVNKCKSKCEFMCWNLGVKDLGVLPKYMCSYKSFV